MNVAPLNVEGLPASVVDEITRTGALLEITETRSNGRALRGLRVVYGPLDPNFMSEAEVERITAQNGPGLFGPPEPPAAPDPDLTRAQFERLSPAERMAYIQTRRPLLD